MSYWKRLRRCTGFGRGISAVTRKTCSGGIIVSLEVSMDTEVIEAMLDDKPIIRHLMELYQHDLSEFDGEDVNDHGLFGYIYLDNYWVEDGRFPFLIRVDGKLGGFVLVNQHSYTEEGEYCIAEFFVLRKYRRQGVGRKAAQVVFDKFPVMWEVGELKIPLLGVAIVAQNVLCPFRTKKLL